MRQLIVAALAVLLTATTTLADELVPLPAPADRPYPYQVLDIQPGQIATKAIPQIEEHLGGPLSPIIMQQVVTSPTGRQFKADLTTGYKTTAVSLYTTMGDEPFESVTLTTTTPVAFYQSFESRVS